MRKILLTVSTMAAVLLAGGCAKQPSAVKNEDARRYFEAWINMHYPSIDKKEGSHGIYVIEEGGTPGAAIEWNSDVVYAIVRYTATDLDGNITASSYESVNRKLGKYDPSYYYGPQVWSNSYYLLPSGVKEMLDGMTIGQTRTAVIPGWLMGYKKYDTEEKYLANVTGRSPAIYTVELVDTAKNIYTKQLAMIDKFIEDYRDEKGNRWEEESQYTGFYFHEIDPGATTDGEGQEKAGFEKNTSISIFYTGSLLKGAYEPGNTDYSGGQVFDTQDAILAKKHNIYKPSSKYGSMVKATWSNDTTSIALNGSTSLVTGFSSTLKRLNHYGAHGIGIFYSSLGYGTSGSGDMIPAYAPMIFEIWIQEEEEE